MQEFNQHGNGLSLRKYCQMEGIDYNWLLKYKKSYGPSVPSPTVDAPSLIPLVVEEQEPPISVWQVSHLRLESPDGVFIDINSNNLAAVTLLLQSLSSPC